MPLGAPTTGNAGRPGRSAELGRIEAYYDLVPRANADTETIGPFTLFLSHGDFPYYARPLANGGPVTVDDVLAVRGRQRELGVPEAFEWVGDLRPDLLTAVQGAGLTVFQAPLLVHRGNASASAPAGVTVRFLTGDDPALSGVLTAIGLGFTTPGTAVGAVGDAERDDADDGSAVSKALRQRIDDGLFVLAGAFGARGPIGGGRCSPRSHVAEITGVATLPAYRRRGVGAAVTSALVAEAGRRGVMCCFLSAGSDQVARVYERAGFVRIGTACIAGAPAAPDT